MAKESKKLNPTRLGRWLEAIWNDTWTPNADYLNWILDMPSKPAGDFREPLVAFALIAAELCAAEVLSTKSADEKFFVLIGKKWYSAKGHVRKLHDDDGHVWLEAVVDHESKKLKSMVEPGKWAHRSSSGKPHIEFHMNDPKGLKSKP